MEKVHYVYHWNRIFGAIATGVLLLTAISYAVYSLVKPEQPQGPEEIPSFSFNQEATLQEHTQPIMSENQWMVTASKQPLDPPPSMPVNGPSLRHEIDHSSNSSVSSTQTQHTVLEENSLPAYEVVNEPQQSGADTEQPSIMFEATAITLQEPDTKQVSLPDHPRSATLQARESTTIPRKSEAIAQEPFGQDTKETLLPDQPQLSMLQETETITTPRQSEAEKADTLQDADNNKTFYLQKIISYSPAVKRFTLARAISNKEPIGTVESISMDANGVAIIYAFSEIGDMRDRILYYYWYHEGERVAKVPVHIGADRWRSNSSKYINIKMQGEWLVELHADDDQILASAKFYNGAQ